MRSGPARPHRLLLAALGALALLAAPPAARAQTTTGRNEVFAESELERYLRALQLTGQAAAYPWSIRGFSPAELDRLAPADSAHPWAARYPLSADTAAGLRVSVVRPEARAVFNSAFPYGANDGPVWAGRGATASIRGGGSARWRGVSLTVAPVLFAAQNASFDLLENGETGDTRFGEGRYWRVIDLPQRFGDGTYARLDPGESTLRLDARGVAVGVSTAAQQWGPAGEHPLILGTNAGGFPHAFLGTARPVGVGIARVHGRIVWGRLDRSAYSAATTDARRFMSGAVLVVEPKGLPGLELGVSRFFHTSWPQGGLAARHFLRPVGRVLKGGLADTGSEDDVGGDLSNQLASVFARWAFLRSGLEVYGELAKEDHNWDLRDLLLEPDHAAGYLLGLRKAWRRPEGRMRVLRAEVLSTHVRHLEIAREQAPFYVNTTVAEGHTLRGQALGSAGAFGGAASVLGLDLYRPGGRVTVQWDRLQRGEDPGSAPDVVHGLWAEALVFRGRLDLGARAGAAYELNRHYGGNALNLNLSLHARVGL